MSKKARLKRGKNDIEKSVSPVEVQDRSPIVHQKSKLRNDLHIFHRQLTPNQQAFLDMALDKHVKMVLVSGPAGTAKTYLSVLAALELLNQRKMSDIVYVRSVVESADVKMGFLPGERDDKFSPYLRPLMDKLEELLPIEDIKYLEGESRLEGLPVGYLRGLNWNAKIIIGDEMQNCTKKELVTLMTRTGEFSKLFLIGDPTQADINGRSGLQTVFDLFNDDESRVNGIYTFQFTEEDIVRSKLVQFIAKKVKNLA
jgi:phosphate starvation-inducible protein PhoH